MQVIWLILAELICFFQRFSHACVSRVNIKRNCERLITTDIIYLFYSFKRITAVILEPIRAKRRIQQ